MVHFEVSHLVWYWELTVDRKIILTINFHETGGPTSAIHKIGTEAGRTVISKLPYLNSTVIQGFEVKDG